MKKVVYIAREADGQLFCYADEPVKVQGGWKGKTIRDLVNITDFPEHPGIDDKPVKAIISITKCDAIPELTDEPMPSTGRWETCYGTFGDISISNDLAFEPKLKATESFTKGLVDIVVERALEIIKNKL